MLVILWCHNSYVGWDSSQSSTVCLDVLLIGIWRFLSLLCVCGRSSLEWSFQSSTVFSWLNHQLGQFRILLQPSPGWFIELRVVFDASHEWLCFSLPYRRVCRAGKTTFLLDAVRNHNPPGFKLNFDYLWIWPQSGRWKLCRLQSAAVPDMGFV